MQKERRGKEEVEEREKAGGVLKGAHVWLTRGKAGRSFTELHSL